MLAFCSPPKKSQQSLPSPITWHASPSLVPLFPRALLYSLLSSQNPVCSRFVAKIYRLHKSFDMPSSKSLSLKPFLSLSELSANLVFLLCAHCLTHACLS